MGVPKKVGGMGFRDIDSFNKAMLAKQCWRFLTNTKSLAATMLKEKYFRHVELLDAKLGYCPSVMWRSLWGSLNLIREGVSWHVGNGKRIKFWEDKWVVSTLTYRKIQAPANTVNRSAMVEDFIDTTKGEWRGDLLKEVLGEEEADTVKTIPISRLGFSDKQIWGYTKSGLFSIKSAYHLERMSKGEPSSTNSESGTWKEVWKLNAPAAVKTFLWRAINNCLPTKLNLLKRKIVESSMCPICSREVESITHSLWSCAASSDVWAESESLVKKNGHVSIWTSITYGKG